MKVVVDASGTVQAIGNSDFATPDNGAVVDTGLTLADFSAAVKAGQALGTPYRIVYDRTSGKLSAQSRSVTAQEAENTKRAKALQAIDDAIDNWPNLTAAQKADALLLNLRATQAIARYLTRRED